MSFFYLFCVDPLVPRLVLAETLVVLHV